MLNESDPAIGFREVKLNRARNNGESAAKLSKVLRKTMSYMAHLRIDNRRYDLFWWPHIIMETLIFLLGSNTSFTCMLLAYPIDFLFM